MDRSPLPPAARRLGADQRGAMMVMGVFVSMFLVGALWAIAGLGEAVVMRERMQEASDATALAAAMIDARAMNVMVLFNLIMASILSIRVLLNGLYIAALIVAAVFAALALIPFAGAAFALIAAAATAMAGVVLTIRQNVDPEITKYMLQFDQAMNGIAQTTPSLAMAAGGIPGMYSPPLVPQQPQAATGVSVSPGAPLPVTLGSPQSLCDKALLAVPTEVDDIVNQSKSSIVAQTAGAVFDAAIPFVTKVVEGTSFLYGDLCELPNVSGSLVVGGAVQDLSNSCNSPTIDVNGTPKPAQAGACSSSAPGGPDEVALQAAIAADAGPQIQAAQDQLTKDQNDCNTFNQGCSSTAQQQSSAPPNVTITPINANTQPFVVDKNFMSNGGPLAQIFTDVQMDPSGPMVSFAPKFVVAAARGQASAGPPPENWDHSFSQAEFFYDCTDTWANCNNNDDAMWNYYWRARLRTFSVKAANEAQVLGGLRCNFIVSNGSTCTLDGRQATVIANVVQSSNQVIGKLRDELAGGTSPAQIQMLQDINRLSAGEGPSLVVH